MKQESFFMRKNLPFTVTAPHVLPEMRYCKLENGKYADTAEFFLDKKADCSKGRGRLEKLFPFRQKDGFPFLVEKWENAPDKEGYFLEITTEKIVLKFASARGYLHACRTLKQLRNGSFIPCGIIEDYPALPLRGFHVNLASCRQFEEDDVRALLEKAGKFKLNTFLLEYNERFPFSSHPAISSCNAFTKEDVRSFEKICAENAIEIIPLVQCLGHNAHINRLEEYGKYFEPDFPDGRKSAQLCPLSGEAFTLFTTLAKEILEAHPNGKYLHIGGDEARSMGMCPKCQEYVQKYGEGKLYVEYINKCAAFVRNCGRIPIIWDDMLSRHPDLMEKMDKDIVIMVWDYWTTSDPSPITVFRPAERGIVVDKSMAEGNFAKLEQPEKLIAETFARVEEFETLAESNEGSKIFSTYLGKDFPQKCTAFPFVDLYKDKGFTVIGAPTTLGNTVDDIYGLPNFMRFRKNIFAYAQKCKKYSLSGMITTSWYDFPPEILEMGLICTANDLWTK